MASSELIEQCREFRKKPTKAEAYLWDYLRANQLDGYKFCRQYPVGGFILDFYCIRARLGIEVDGDVHRYPVQVELDHERTKELQDMGIEIIRFWNSKVLNDIDSVLQQIRNSIENRTKWKPKIKNCPHP
jgi:very-short-patch-repair endonuclease